MADYQIVFDGGSKGNGSPDSEGYGSYRLTGLDGLTGIWRLEFPAGTTNNEAEYRSLIAALSNLLAEIEDAGQTPGNCTVAIMGDSKLVLYQVHGEWKVKAENLHSLCDTARSMVAQFREVEFRWTPREEIVEILGH